MDDAEADAVEGEGFGRLGGRGGGGGGGGRRGGAEAVRGRGAVAGWVSGWVAGAVAGGVAVAVRPLMSLSLSGPRLVPPELVASYPLPAAEGRGWK